MVVVNPVPGQEDRNCDFLLENGAAVKANALSALAWKVSTLLDDRHRLTVVRANAAQLGRPTAAADIAADVLGAISAAGDARTPIHVPPTGLNTARRGTSRKNEP
ncbi:MAG: hypothetical protein QM783_04325 [Phycisphaerales bacterium]